MHPFGRICAIIKPFLNRLMPSVKKCLPDEKMALLLDEMNVLSRARQSVFVLRPSTSRLANNEWGKTMTLIKNPKLLTSS
jgi:hypothetical protein